MSTTENRIGFEIRGKFYPLVSVGNWRNSDFILAHDLTHRDASYLFSGQADYLTVQMALIAVAVAHKRPELAPEQIARFVGALKPDTVNEIGFENDDEEDEDEAEDEEGGVRPPVTAPEPGSAASSETASAATPQPPGAPSGTAA